MMSETLISIAQYMNQQACIVEEPGNRGHYDAILLSAAYARHIEAACRNAQQNIDKLKAERDALTQQVKDIDDAMSVQWHIAGNLRLEVDELKAERDAAKGMILERNAKINEMQLERMQVIAHLTNPDLPSDDVRASFARLTLNATAPAAPTPTPQPVDMDANYAKAALTHAEHRITIGDWKGAIEAIIEHLKGGQS